MDCSFLLPRLTSSMEAEPRAFTCVTFKTLKVKGQKFSPSLRSCLPIWITSIKLSEESSCISRLINRPVLHIHANNIPLVKKEAIHHTCTGFVNWARISDTGLIPVHKGQPRCAYHLRGRWLLQRIWSCQTFLFASTPGCLIGISEHGDRLSLLF